MDDFVDVRGVADIRSQNIFRDGHGSDTHSSYFSLRQYTISDLLILVLVVLGTLLVNKFILTKR